MDEAPSEITARVAKARAAFKAIRLDHPAQIDLVAALDELRMTGLASPGTPMGGIQVLAAWGTGKSTAAAMFKTYVEGLSAPAEGRKPVVIATLDTTGTAKSVPMSILAALGSPRPDVGSEPRLWFRAKADLRDSAVEMLILDEIDRATRRPMMSAHIAGSLRDLADEGIVPVAYLGTEAARSLFRNCADLDERLDAPVTLNPLDLLLEEDLEIFTVLVRGFDERMVADGILRRKSGLDDKTTVRLLGEASSGILRRLARIIETAMIAVVRRNGAAIEPADLADAVDAWAIPKGHIAYNPFRAR